MISLIWEKMCCNPLIVEAIREKCEIENAHITAEEWQLVCVEIDGIPLMVDVYFDYELMELQVYPTFFDETLSDLDPLKLDWS
jgi:hypothetical protein